MFHDSWLTVIVPQILRFNFYQWENTWTFDDRHYKNVSFFFLGKIEWTVYMWSLPVMIRRLFWCSYYQIWRQTKPEPQGFNSTKLRGLGLSEGITWYCVNCSVTGEQAGIKHRKSNLRNSLSKPEIIYHDIFQIISLPLKKPDKYSFGMTKFCRALVKGK